MPSAKRKELAEFQLQTWTLVILTDPRFSEKCGTIVPMTQMANEKEMSFPSLRWRWGVPGALQTCPGGWLNQCCHLGKGIIWSGSDDHKEASRVDLLPSWLLKDMLRVTDFTGHCSLFSWEATRRKDTMQVWMVCGLLSSTAFPSLPLPPWPTPCLTARTLLCDLRSLCILFLWGSCWPLSSL